MIAVGACSQPIFQPVTENVLPADEGLVLVDLVGDDEHVVPAGEFGDELELGSGEDLAGRVVRRVEQDQLRPLAECGGQLIRIEGEVRPAQHDSAASRS